VLSESACAIISTHRCVISREECRALIELSENLGYESALINGAFNGPRGFVVQTGRNNSRFALEDTGLADALWRRVARAVPEKLNQQSVVGLNERLRFYRYEAGQSFGPHTDGIQRAWLCQRQERPYSSHINSGTKGVWSKRGASTSCEPT
jgi:prolyl 4-hydroxylase